MSAKPRYDSGQSAKPTDYKTFDQLTDSEKATLKSVLASLFY